MLWSRVEDYECAWLEQLCYQDRLFFDYGTILMIYPGRDLPYFQRIMQNFHDRFAAGSSEAQDVHQHVLEAISRRGPLANRDFQNRTRIPGGFNMVKDTSSALYHLYLSGQVMTHCRRNFERVYDLTHNIALTVEDQSRAISNSSAIKDHQDNTQVSMASLSELFALKTIRDVGLATPAQWARRVSIMEHKRTSARQAVTRLESLVAAGKLTHVAINGEKEPYYMPAEDGVLLDALLQKDVPGCWQPRGVTTLEEVSFLAPLDNVIWDRPRTQALFDFTYVWEVYKPAHTRRWGYYTLPILYGDQLVGRIAPRLDRKSQTLNIEGFWLESEVWAEDASFRAALRAGLQRFARFHKATRLNISIATTNQPGDLNVIARLGEIFD